MLLYINIIIIFKKGEETMAKYTGGQVLTDSIEGLKKKKFTLATMTFFIYCACAGGAFGIESMISAAGPGLTLLLLVLIPFLMGAANRFIFI